MSAPKSGPVTQETMSADVVAPAQATDSTDDFSALQARPERAGIVLLRADGLDPAIARAAPGGFVARRFWTWREFTSLEAVAGWLDRMAPGV